MKRFFIPVCALALLFPLAASAAENPPQIPVLITESGPRYSSAARKWQGIPSIERAPGGRLWATWYAGLQGEGQSGNFQVLVTSADDGKTWSEPVVAFHPHPVDTSNTGDGHLWVDPKGRMWFFLNRYLASDKPPHPRTVWAFYTENPDDARPRWSAPTLVSYGLVLNKPTVLKNGEWLNPIDFFSGDPNATDPRWGKGAKVYSSTDQGRTWNFKSELQIPDVTFGEHMFVERKDGSIWVLARTKYGIAQSESHDGGKTWSVGEPFTKEFNVNTRFYLRRLNSGRILLIVNNHERQRRNMTAMLSDDEGKTWPHKLLLDERTTSYPDATAETKEGFFYVIYDQDRYRKDSQQILFAKLTEHDIVAGKLVNPGSLLQQKINRLADHGGGVDDAWTAWYDAFRKARTEAEAKKKSDAEKKSPATGAGPVQDTPEKLEAARTQRRAR